MADEFVTRTFLALFSAFCGGLGIKLLEKALPDAAKALDYQSSLRNELRIEASTLRQELTEARKAYMKLQESYIQLKSNYALLIARYQELAGDDVVIPEVDIPEVPKE